MPTACRVPSSRSWTARPSWPSPGTDALYAGTGLSSGPGWCQCLPGSTSTPPLVQRSPSGVLGSISVDLWSSELEWVLLAMGRGHRTGPAQLYQPRMSVSPGRASSPGQHWPPPAGPAGAVVVVHPGPLTLGGWAVRDGHVTDSGFGVSRSDEFWPWMSHVLLPYIHGNQSRPELGPPRLRQVRLQEGESPRGTLALSLTCFQREAFARVWIQCPRLGDCLPWSPDMQTVTPTSWGAGRAR